jgi:DNA-binding MarR family transcriptional regulator
LNKPIFFDALKNIQEQLMKKLETKGIETKLSPKEKSILTFIENHVGCKSGEIAKKFGIPSPTVKRILPKLINKNLIEKYGTGPETNY